MVRLDNEVRHVFPNARELASAGRYSLRDLQLARKIDRDPDILDGLAQHDVTSSDAARELDRYSGIGPKIANCAALMSLDKLDAFPVDLWVQRALSKCDLSSMPEGRVDLAQKVRNLEKLTESQQYQVAEWAKKHFGEYAGYAGQYLFHWIEPVKERVRRGKRSGWPRM